MTLDVQTVDDVAVVKLTSQALDDTNLQAVGEQLFRLVDEEGRHKLHLDFANVRFVPSTGLGKLVALNKKVRGVGGHLALVNVPDPVYEAIRATRLDRLLDVRRKEAG